MKPCPFALTVSLSGVLLLSTPLGLPLVSPLIAAEPSSLGLSPQQMQQLAGAVTVKVFAGNSSGSGTLILKDGATYTVMTNAHVLQTGEPYRIQTVDGKSYVAKMPEGMNFAGRDVALLQFESQETYKIPSKITTDLQVGEKVFAAGFADGNEQLTVAEGVISLLPEKHLVGGYKIGYSNDIQQGMSGGPVFNRNGELIGINGRRAFPIVEEYRFEDGSQPDAKTKDIMRRSSWGIAVTEILAKIDAISFYQQGITHYQNKDYPKALEAFNEAINRYPSYAEAYYERAIARMQSAHFYQHDDSMASFLWKRQRKDAKSDMEQAAKWFAIQGNKEDAERAQAYAYWYGEEKGRAIDAFTRALQLDAQDVPAYLGRGRVYLSLDKYDEAIADFNKAVELQPNSAIVYNARAIAYYQKKDFQAADADLTKAIKLDPKFIEAYYTRGYLSSILNKPQEALADYNKAVELKPDYAEAYHDRGLIYFWKTDFEAALADFNKAIELNPNYSFFYIYRGFVYFRQKNYQQAINNANQFLQPDVDEAEVGYYLRGRSQLELGNCAAARPDLEQAAQLMRKKGATDNIFYLDTQEALKISCERDAPSIANVMPEVDKIAQQITVKIDVADVPGCRQGSGVIVARQDSRYSVLTARHVIDGCPKFRIITPDGQSYEVSEEAVQSINDADLAVFGFTSSQPYTVATLGNYTIKKINWIFVSGFPASENSRQLRIGNFVPEEIGQFFTTDSRSFTYGYRMIYTNLTAAGMSGGPVLDRKGQVIGIHGRAEGEDLILQSGQSRPIALGWSLGVPIRTFIQSTDQINIPSDRLTLETTEPEPLPLTQNISLRDSLYKSIPVPDEQADATAWLNYGNQLYRLDLMPEAKKAFQNALQLQPDSYQAWYGIGLLEFVLDKNAALEAFKKVTQLKPDFIPGWYRQGMALRDLERYEEAVSIFTKVIELESKQESEDRKPVAAYFQRGAAYQNLEDYPKAIADFDRAIQLAPNSPSLYKIRGDIYREAKKYPQAIADYTKAIALDPEYQYAYNQRGLAYDELEDYQNAIADYTKVIELDPKYATPYNNRGMVYYDLQDYGKALADLNKATELEPKDFTYYSNRAAVYIELEDLEKALAEYTKFIEIDSKSASSYNYRGVFYFKILKDYQKAIDDFTTAIEIDPKEITYYHNRADAYTKLKNYPRAEAEYNAVIKRFPKSAQSYSGRGSFYADPLKDYKKAITDYTKAIELAPKEPSYYGNRAVAYRELKDYAKAIEQCYQALKIKPDYLWAYQQLGWIAYQKGNFTEAINHFKQALSIDEKYANANYAIGIVKYEMGDKEAAIQQWQTTLKINKKDEGVIFTLAVALFAQGNQEEAMKLAATALKKDSDIADLTKLKEDYLWGDSLLTAAQQFLATPQVQALVSKNE